MQEGAQELDRAWIRPVQVVQHEYERLRGREQFEELSYGSMAAKALLLNGDALAQTAFRQRRKNSRELALGLVGQTIDLAPLETLDILVERVDEC